MLFKNNIIAVNNFKILRYYNIIIEMFLKLLKNTYNNREKVILNLNPRCELGFEQIYRWYY